MTRDAMPDRVERERLASAPVTLNGAPARISGTRCDFARVTQSGTGLGAEWSWQTVAHVVANHGGHFVS